LSGALLFFMEGLSFPRGWHPGVVAAHTKQSNGETRVHARVSSGRFYLSTGFCPSRRRGKRPCQYWLFFVWPYLTGLRRPGTGSTQPLLTLVSPLLHPGVIEGDNPCGYWGSLGRRPEQPCALRAFPRRPLTLLAGPVQEVVDGLFMCRGDERFRQRSLMIPFARRCRRRT
jgi:hypothetical protein